MIKSFFKKNIAQKLRFCYKHLFLLPPKYGFRRFKSDSVGKTQKTLFIFKKKLKIFSKPDKNDENLKYRPMIYVFEPLQKGR